MTNICGMLRNSRCHNIFPGGYYIFSYICRLGLFLGASKFRISIIFWVNNTNVMYKFGNTKQLNRKMNIFGGYEVFVDIFGGSSLCISVTFFKVKGIF